MDDYNMYTSYEWLLIFINRLSRIKYLTKNLSFYFSMIYNCQSKLSSDELDSSILEILDSVCKPNTLLAGLRLGVDVDLPVLICARAGEELDCDSPDSESWAGSSSLNANSILSAWSDSLDEYPVTDIVSSLEKFGSSAVPKSMESPLNGPGQP